MLDTLSNFLGLDYSILGLIIEFCCLATKFYVLFSLYKNFSNSIKNKAGIYLLIVLLTGIFTNITLIFYYLSLGPWFVVPVIVSKVFFKLECATILIQFFMLLCFSTEISSKALPKKILKLFLIPVIFLNFYFLFRSVYIIYSTDYSRFWADYKILDFSSAYLLGSGLVSLIILYRNYKREQIQLLQYHNLILFRYFMLPYWFMKIFESSFVSFTINPMAASVTSIILTGMIFYSVKRVTGSRFLNMDIHVKSTIAGEFNFVDDFKDVLVKFGSVSNVNELIPLSRDFFEKAFNISKDKVVLFFKDSWMTRQQIVGDAENNVDARKHFVEKMFSSTSDNHEIIKFANDKKILILDEIEFDHFYATSSAEKAKLAQIVAFLKEINVDIFLPVYCESKIVGFVLVNRNSRPGKFYTDVDRDEMLIYVNYLGTIVYFLTHMNLDAVLQREHNLKVSSYKKDKLIELLRKSISPFLEAKTQKIGVMTYKNKKFVYSNQASKDLLKVDINTNKNLEVSQDITQIGFDTATTFLSKRQILSLPEGDNLLVVSSPHLEKDNTVITLSVPSIGDLVKEKMSYLRDASKWSYLLALENTEEGQIINQLVPANSPALLNLKINFLEHATTSKTIFLDLLSTEDALSFAHGVHRINKRSIFEEVVVDNNTNENSLSLKLFGMNPIFKENNEVGLFESLNKTGTILIQNVHLLSLNLQKKLLEFIVAGKFTLLKSEISKDSDLFLICSCNQNLQGLVSQGLFLKELYFELGKTAVWMPSIASLPEEDFFELIEGLRLQLIYSKIYKNLLVFNEMDRSKLLDAKCVSINELKTKIQSIILKKTKRQTDHVDSVIDPAYQISDFDLIEAARLGKNVLKDPKKLSMLLHKFKYNQSKVALFLNVNRSTVSRRCTQFGLDHLGNSNENESLEV